MRFAPFPVLVWFGCLAQAQAVEPPDFDRQIAPIFAGRCLDCHSGTEPKGGLNLSHAQGIQNGGESGAALVAGNPADSLLWLRVDAEEMPPKHPLPKPERELLRAWIAAGAKWGTDPIDPFRYTTTVRGGYDWWSLQPLKPPPVRVVPGPKSKVQSPVDAFIFSKLEQRGLSSSPPANRQTLIRRLYFDLVGLPPSPEEVESFAADKDSYEALVDKLLDSPHYGERWARHWLDVAHFGESDGFEYDRMRPSAWRYRDWVIQALNRDLPYDEFARLQIAGDVLRPGEADAVIATGFLVAGAHDSLLPKGDVMQMIMRQDELEDLVGIVGQTFLGLTVHCARCHDHKFDPIRQTDYYRLASALAGVKRGNRNLPPREPPPELVARQRAARGELVALEQGARERVLKNRKVEIEKRPVPPQPIARWEFDGDLRDSIGELHGTAQGQARLDEGTLIVGGRDAYVTTPPLAVDLAEKTLDVWLKLGNLEQRGGGAIGVQSLDGGLFDAIVFGEREPRRWLAGSNFFRRTQSLAEAADEQDAKDRFVHIAIAYHADGQIAAYRDGRPYGKPYQSEGLARFAAGNSQVVLGLRHSPLAESKVLTGRIDRASLYDRALSAEEVAAAAQSGGTVVSEVELAAQLDEAARTRRAALQTELKRLDEEIKAYRDQQVFAVTPQEAPVMHLLNRGNVLQPGAEVPPGGIACLTVSRPDFGLAAAAADDERRKKLAEWIASDKNPLFARTIVNRLWHYHFGRGLVETPNDLGFSGGRPEHRELLDWLASELIAKKWSLKELHRTIVLSATYRQESRPRADCLAADADNRLLWRFSPRRLEAESVRDAILVAAGQLNRQMGGPSYQDFRPYVYKTTQYYEPLDPVGPEFNRRSIYRMWARGGKNPLLDTFDCPDPSTTAPKRGATTTPLQALSLFNNSFTLRMADHMAERLAKERPKDINNQVRRAFELTYGRPASDEERSAAEAFIRQHGLAAFCRVLLNANGFLYVN